MFITDIISMLDNGFIVNIQVPRRRVKKVKNKGYELLHIYHVPDIYINNCVCVSNLISISQYALWPFILGLSAYIVPHELMALKTKFKKWILFAFALEASLCFPPAPPLQPIPNKH